MIKNFKSSPRSNNLKYSEKKFENSLCSFKKSLFLGCMNFLKRFPQFTKKDMKMN